MRFELTDKPLWLSWCHCTPCRKVGGMANLMVRAVLHEHVAEKAPWYEILEGLPQYPGDPPR